jgi:hypothetical protein
MKSRLQSPRDRILWMLANNGGRMARSSMIFPKKEEKIISLRPCVIFMDASQRVSSLFIFNAEL